MSHVGVITIASEAYDIALATAEAADAVDVIGANVETVTAAPDPLLHADDVSDAIEDMESVGLDALILLHGTFTEASLALRAASIGVPLVLWSFPEERTGRAPRLDSLSAMNLAGHALLRHQHAYGWIYRTATDASAVDDLRNALEGRSGFHHVPTIPEEELLSSSALARVDELRRRLHSTRIGLIGDAPAGFTTSEFDYDDLDALLGIEVERRELTDLFALARGADQVVIEEAQRRMERRLGELSEVDATAAQQSLRLHAGLEELIEEGGWSGVATRCWPECFTEFGGALCAANSMLSDERIATACEADVIGTVTNLVLEWLADEPAFSAALVDLERGSNTGAIRHCGLGPIHMADPHSEHRPANHPIFGLPLLNEFPLKPGPVTIARMSRAGSKNKMAIGSGEMMRAPSPFAGTSGVLRFDRPVQEVLDSIMGEGLEHHYGIVYGDVREELRALAARLRLPVVDL